MGTQYNAAKNQILAMVEKLGEATTIDIAELTDRRYENCGVLMLSYHRHGLLNRRKLKGTKAYAYSISSRGLERLAWLRENED